MIAGGPFPLRLLATQPTNGSSGCIDTHDEVLCLDVISSRVVRNWVGQLRWYRFQTAYCRLRLLAQCGRKCSDSGEKILALLLPARLDDLVVLGVEHRGQIFGNVVFKIEPGFGVGAPGVFNFQE